MVARSGEKICATYLSNSQLLNSVGYISSMSDLCAVVLGFIQGVTEFLPVSSSTHLLLAKRMMGIAEERSVFFDLFCHMGTLLASCLVLRKELWQTLTQLRSFALVAVALLPLPLAYFLFQQLRASLTEYAPLFLFVTGGFLFVASYSQKTVSSGSKWRDVLCIGAAQGFALLPGISRE